LISVCLTTAACGGGGGDGGGNPGTDSGGGDDGSVDVGGDTGGGDGGCLDQCGSGESQCAGAQILKCEKQANGCLGWTKPADCPQYQTCLGGSCVLACSDKCIDGNTQCNSGKLQTCAKQTNGCTAWNTATDCPSGQTCSGGACVSSCTDQCTSGASRCSGVQIQTCAKQTNGCLDWSAAEACPTNQACSGATNKCALTCTDQCTASATQCSGVQLQTCGMQTNGCLGWNPATTCPTKQACSGGACVASCTDKCTLGTKQCSGTQIQTCSVQTSGCLDWDAAVACTGGLTCVSGACVVQPCTTGDTRCNGTVVESCDSAGKWQTQQVCAQSCDTTTKACATTSVTCTPNARRCSGTTIQVCNSTGTAWLAVQTCANACSGGLCTGACSPGAKRCNGNVPETCNAGGSAWTAGTTCTTACIDATGACADAAQTIDANANAVLEGEHWINGDLVLKNSSVLTSKTGNLIIHAKNVTIDASSQIVVQATGSDARGKGANGQTGTCSYWCTYSGYTYYYTSSAVNVGGAGGGYGASGTTSSVVGYAGSSSCSSCSVTSAGGGAYAIADDEAAPGAAGGDCSGNAGGKGGGLLAIYADNIQIAGTITANGQAGTNCAGGGSGGAIILRATGDLTFSGTLSATGGAGGSSGGGAGGNGVVKLLYGNTKSLTGTVYGTKFQSFMPPFDVVSTSHPDPTRWYNDGFSSFELAWSKPFTNGAGYYYNLNTTYGTVPAPATSLYLAGESILYPPSGLVSGTNYFHVDTVGPFANVGTVEHRFKVLLNTATPTISSTSHPSGSTWYANVSPYFSWTVPHSDADVTNFYWVFDPYPSTIPTKTANKIPMDLITPQNSKQLLLPNQPVGIWFLHVIAEDTMGYLTKTAASYRVQLGPNPGQGSISGFVKDGSGNAVSGATISLNRGLQTTTTSATGNYAFPSSVWAQAYEVTASKSGFKDSVSNTTVTSGSTSTVNFTLTP
jgi:hypothetical protein